MKMAAATMTATYPGGREATMDYIRPDSKMNRRYMSAGKEVSTGRYEARKVLVHDARPETDKFTLETTGFQLIKHESKVNFPLFMTVSVLRTIVRYETGQTCKSWSPPM